MKATQFIKDHGLERARGVVAQALDGHNKFDVSKNQTVEIYKTRNHLVDLRHLKRLVESVDLVNAYGGAQEAEWHISEQDDLPEYCYRLRAALDDYESIYGEGNE